MRLIGSLRFFALVVAFGVFPFGASGGPVVAWGFDPVPDAVNGIAGTASDIAPGGFHSCAIQAGTGSVVCWGNDRWGLATTPPDAVNGVSGTATDIAAGFWHSLAIAVPEPSRGLLLASGVGALVLLRRMRRQR